MFYLKIFKIQTKKIIPQIHFLKLFCLQQNKLVIQSAMFHFRVHIWSVLPIMR